MRLFMPAALLLSVLIAACDTPVEQPASHTGHPAYGVGSDFSADAPAVQKDLAQLRAALSPLHTLEAANDAGFNTQLTPCLELPGVGGMGIHWANAGRIDGQVSLLEPEILLYSPRSNGTYGLGAVEYIVPLNLSATPPTLMGQQFHPNPAVGVWMLHVWLWNNNPAGIFADWNPTVSCPTP